MKKNSNTIWSGIIWGLITALLFTILGAAIGAAILSSGSVPENAASWLNVIIWAISSFCGTMLTLKLTIDKKLLSASITAGTYLLILIVMNLLVFEQQLIGVWKGILAVLITVVIAVLLNNNKPKAKRRKTKYRPG